MNPAPERPAVPRTATDSDLPAASSVELLPARMLNEFVYCPRLFFYEHVEGVFVHNADTRRGAADHKRVDGGKGELPKARKKSEVGDQKSGDSAEAPDDGAADEQVQSGDPEIENRESRVENSEIIHSRSVMLGSESLGVVAKLDLVEVTLNTASHSTNTVADAGPDNPKSAIQNPQFRVCPVEYKAGAPREGAAEGTLDLWDTDRMQLGLQILLLRENGYACDEGVIFYRQTRQRVRFVLTAEDDSWIRRTIALARAATRGPIPPPLDHSPKCPRCSLVSVCLPDETRLLRDAPDAELPNEAQLGLPGFLLEEGAATDSDALADALSADEPALDNLPEPQMPRPAFEGGVRRLIAPDIDTKALYVNTPGVSVLKKGETVVVKDKAGALAEIRIKDLHHLAIFGPASLSTALVQTLCERDVPVSYFSMGGWFYGLTRGHGLTNVFTRIQQFRRAGDHEQALPLARLFVYGKIRNQRTLLMRNHVEPPQITLRALKHAASAALAANSHATLLGIEGAAALHYFKNFSGMIKGPDDNDDLPGLEESPAEKTLAIQQQFNFDFKTRNRRPPRDPVNALLSFAYSLLVRDCTIAACAVGFDPYVGFFHQPRFGRPALALDVMEEFRPLIADSVVLTAINNRMLGPSDFVQAGDAVNLSSAGRKRFLFAYEKRMSDTITHPVFDYKVSYRRALELQFRLLARTLTGEIERYVPFTTR
jgi:CRISPR-associated protein Cas1